MDDACAANNNAPAAAAMTVTTMTKKRLPSGMEDDRAAAGGKKTRRSSYMAESVKAGTRGKRRYEHDEHELDMSTCQEKLFKCNYWEDPAYAKRLEYFVLSLARNAAHNNEFERLDRELDVWLAACQQDRPDAAAAALRRMGCSYS